MSAVLPETTASVEVAGVRFARFGISGWYRWTGVGWGPLPDPLWLEPMLDEIARLRAGIGEALSDLHRDHHIVNDHPALAFPVCYECGLSWPCPTERIGRTLADTLGADQ